MSNSEHPQFDELERAETLRQLKAKAPETFALYRTEDVSGVSGEGVVAYGTQFSDGTVVIRWLGEHQSTNIWPSLDDAMEVHGHDGRTSAVWLKEEVEPEPERVQGTAYARASEVAERLGAVMGSIACDADTRDELLRKGHPLVVNLIRRERLVLEAIRKFGAADHNQWRELRRSETEVIEWLTSVAHSHQGLEKKPNYGAVQGTIRNEPGQR